MTAAFCKKAPIIGLCGYPRVGKDSIAQILCTHHGFERIAFADPLRKALLSLDPYIRTGDTYARISRVIETVGWDEAKKIPEVRDLLQRMGTEAGRDIHGEDCWVRIAEREIENCIRPIVVTDVRFCNEVAMLRKHGAMICHVVRPGFEKVNEHSSEQMDYNAISDLAVYNQGERSDIQQMVQAILDCQVI